MDWPLFFVKTIWMLFELTVFIPGIVTFFSLRHAICSCVALIAMIVGSAPVGFLYKGGNLWPENDAVAILTILCSMVACYSLSWVTMHFVLPKTLLSQVSKKVRWIVGAALSVTASLFIFI